MTRNQRTRQAAIKKRQRLQTQQQRDTAAQPVAWLDTPAPPDEQDAWLERYVTWLAPYQQHAQRLLHSLGTEPLVGMVALQLAIIEDLQALIVALQAPVAPE